MKPIKLTFEAYGTFLNRTEIDFTVLNEHGLYLITGPTGSGKTTIFDAIVFALYGKASGDNREQQMLRSDFAPKDIKTFVRLEFLLNGETYIVERSPKYSVPGRKNELPSKASLIMPNGDVIEKVTAVDQKITELLGLTSDQFRQIIMLAQGEFMKLIYAESSEKDKIFRKLFKTDALKNLEEKLKDKLKLAKEDASNKKSLVVDNLREFTDFKEYCNSTTDFYFIPNLIKEANEKLDSDSKELASKVNVFKEKDALLSSSLKEQAKIIQQNATIVLKIGALQTAGNLKLEANGIEKLRKELDYIHKLEKLKPSFDKLEVLEDSKADLTHQQEDKAAEYNEAKNESDMYLDESFRIELDRATLEKTSKELEELKKSKEFLLQVKEKEEKAKEQADLKKSYNDDIKKLEDDYNELLAKQEAQKEVRSNVIAYRTKKAELNGKITEKKGELARNKEKYDLHEKYEEIQAILNVEEAKKNTITESYKEKYDIFDKVQKSYYLSSAALLAEGLEDGKACPVCGSFHHPHLAASCEEVTKADLDKAQKALDKVKDSLTKQEAIITEKQEAGKALYDELLSKLGGTNFLEILDNEKASLEKDLNELVDEFDIITKYLEDNKDIEELVQLTKDKLVALEDDRNRKLILEAECSSKISAFNDDISELRSHLLPGDTLESINELIEDAQETYDLLGDAIRNFDEGKAKADKATSEALKVLEHLNNQLSDTINKFNDAKAKYHELEVSLGLSGKLDFSLINQAGDIQTTITTHETSLKENTKLLESLEDVPEKVTDTDKLDSLIEDLTNEKEALDEEISELKLSTKTLESNIKKLKANYDKYLVSEENRQALANLSDTSNGLNTLHLSFERFVLIDYFDNILKLANKRLSLITNGRYLLNRKDFTKKGSGQQGLDIEIFDYETGKYRDVKSLSGGETFKASLSLALGLADAIEENAGGVSIDCLFIDEGFGSLDKESLFQALNTLIDLRGDNKTIGIISHVAELKELIDATLVVEKDNIGSKVSVKVK